MENLERVKEMIAAKANEKEQTAPKLQSYDDFTKFISETIVDENLKTLSMDYDESTRKLKVQVIKSGSKDDERYIVYFSMNDSQLKAVLDAFEIDVENRKYNDSSNINISGINVRVFAVIKPYRKSPLIVISTAKKPPEKIKSLPSNVDDILKEVIKENFLICGKSGAGKTYLLNYMLNKYCDKNERVGVIQEFTEIYPPTPYSDMMTVPPRTPGQQWNDLEFLTEQSNLMRYDRILVGEIKSSEAWPFIVNCSSGTKGGATIHGESCKHALQRLKTLCLLSRPNLNDTVVNQFIAKAVNYVIYVEDGKVKSIDKLGGTSNNGNFQITSII